jgi:hypothetical protein
MTGERPYWTDTVRQLPPIVALGAAANLLGWFRLPLLTTFYLLAVMAPLTECWCGFRLFACSGQYVPLYANVPFGLTQVVGAMYKLSLVQWLLLLPMLAVAVVVDIAWLGIAPGRELLGVLALSCVGVPMPVWRIAWQLKNTSTLLSLRWRHAHWTLALLAFGLAACFGAMTAFIALLGPPAVAVRDREWFVALSAGLFLVGSYGCWRVCVSVVEGGRCDLVRPTFDAMSFGARRHALWEAHEPRRRRRDLLRRRLGPFWWLPRHMPAERAEEAAP